MRYGSSKFQPQSEPISALTTYLCDLPESLGLSRHAYSLGIPSLSSAIGHIPLFCLS